MSATPTLRDLLAADAHQAWMDENRRNGIATRLSSLTGEEQMAPFDRLSGAVKAYDYALVDVILDSLAKRGYEVAAARGPSVAFALGAPSSGKAGPGSIYPNPALTPGVANPNVTQENIMQTIGVVGWTATIRPPVSATSIIKAHIMQRDNLPGPPSLYELDHFSSLELGGAPLEIGNLWCQPYAPAGMGAHEKDHVENFLKGQVVAGRMTLADAQKAITDDWYAVYLSLNKLGMLPTLMALDPSGDADPDDNA